MEVAATLLLTLILVLITGYYARQTAEMAREMRENRVALQTPRIRLDLWMLKRDHVVVRLVNVGNGAAFDLRVTLSFAPAPEVVRRAELRDWKTPILRPGETQSFHFPSVDEDEMNLKKIAAIYDAVDVSGQCSDSLGNTYEIDDRLTGFPDFLMIYERGDFHPETTVEERLEDIDDSLLSIARRLEEAVILGFRCPECNQPLVCDLRRKQPHTHPSAEQ